MVGPGGTTALWCRWYGTQVRQRLGEPPRVTRAGAGQEACAGGHGGGGGPPGLAALAEKLCLQERIDRTGGVTAAGPVAVWHDEAVLPAPTAAPS
jgi:hypothetical protein